MPDALNLRQLTREDADAIRRAAAARQITLSDYVSRLYHLHAHLRALADGGDRQAAEVLASHGLEPVNT